MDPLERITYFAETDARNKRVPFGIKAKDRTKHVYVIGKTGMGKSTLLENMAIQDIQNGEGFAFLDPHGKTADLFLEYIPKERLKDVVYFAPFDTEYPISFNVMEDVGIDKRHLVVSGLLSAFKKIWVDAWSARMEYILINIILALLEYPDSTLMGVNRMLSDKEYRKKVVDNTTDVSVKSFWVDEFAKYGDRYMQEAGAAIQNKIGQFVTNPLIRNIIGQPKSTFDIRKLMDEKKILIVNLSKGLVGEMNANLLGSMLITKIYLAAMSRADTPEAELRKLPNFYLYVDEFQSFANESFANILSEARKYKLNLTIAHQYIEQMSEEVRAAVLGNVGTMIVFRVGAYDAQVLEKEFAPTFMAQDLVNLGQRQIYLKLMIDDVTSAPFSAGTLPPVKKPESMYVKEVIDFSRTTYARPRAEVEELIRTLHGSQRAVIPTKPEDFQIGNGGRERQERHDRPERRERDERESRRDERPGSSEPPKTHKPFQSFRIEQVDDEAPKIVQEEGERRTISLSALKPASSGTPLGAANTKKKEPTKENVNALRDVLSSILKKPIDVPEDREKKGGGAVPEKPKAEGSKRDSREPSRGNTGEPKEEPKKNAPPQPRIEHAAKLEVPEDVLKRVLKMEE